MQATQFEEAKAIFDRIQHLSDEIINISKIADLISSNPTEITLNLKVEKTVKTPNIEDIFDEYGSLRPNVTGMPSGGAFSFGAVYMSSVTPAKKYDGELNLTPSDVLTLEVLGTIIRSKIAERDILLKQLKIMGIKL